MKSSRCLVVPLTLVGALVGGFVACGGTAKVEGTVKAPTAAPITGQGSLVDGTFAGQNKCNPKNHERPFIIEWDGTDIASFEARAANDVVFVRYEGCELKVVEGCVNDSLRGAQGSYKPVDWTSGTIDRIDIKNESDLYAKLPLGAADFGERVQKGEKLHMEYFVSGVRSATRDAVYRGDLDKLKACKDVTHFVYGYNLGAFTLAVGSNSDASANAKLMSAGTAGRQKLEQSADKNGGLISSCRGENAQETQTCKVPIRLTLRAIDEGPNADIAAASATDTPLANNLAAKLKASTEAQRNAEEKALLAQQKMNARDGRGCLADLDAHDRLDPRPSGLSTEPKSYAAQTRAHCLMLAGQCAAGRDFMRKAIEGTIGSQMGGPERIDQFVEFHASRECSETELPSRLRVQRASNQLMEGMNSKKPASFCLHAYETLKTLRPTFGDKIASDNTLLGAYNGMQMQAEECFIKAGDCRNAWIAYRDEEFHAKVDRQDKDPHRYMRYFEHFLRREQCAADSYGPFTARETFSLARAQLEYAQSSHSPRPLVPAPQKCRDAYARGRAVLPQVPASKDDYEIRDPAKDLARDAIKCLVANGDCAAALTMYSEGSNRDAAATKNQFENEHRLCKAK